ncbi:MAG: sulfotransferase domain-containing protein [Roseovarius sp.]|nr:sulfotransferase domain-containing protein [Roseovarius sp.]MCY4207989.1 sulfotransferase domain-containing protein [Roseovarius sp.]MCY4292642.1 sulfotransferase domain-containing protein [Roseovarius sp.]MCY4317218.1 sulfotransferase domain-containing protein [Roseovarius sp.]
MRRPSNIQEMLLAFELFATDEGKERGLAYVPDSTDVFISPYAKCGTTWMQQIVHGLRSCGDMDFSEITQVVPWIELAHDMGVENPSQQRFSPRAFKSHLNWDEIPKGGRYIVVFRDPLDAMVSLYNFLNGWFFERGSITLPEFADYYLGYRDGRDYWRHAVSWWRQRNGPNVLLLSYEGMKSDLGKAVELVADFIGVYEKSAMNIAKRQAELSFMKAHEHQFDDHLIHQSRDADCGLPAGGVSTKVGQGVSGTGKIALDGKTRAKFNSRWRETMGREFNLGSYAEIPPALASAGSL